VNLKELRDVSVGTGGAGALVDHLEGEDGHRKPERLGYPAERFITGRREPP